MARLMPSDIIDDVYRIIVSAKKGKGKYPNWLTAYQILARLDPNTRQRLEKERCPAGKGGGYHYGAASVVMSACKRLANEDPPRVEISYLDTKGLRLIIDNRAVAPSDSVCGLYRKFDRKRS